MPAGSGMEPGLQVVFRLPNIDPEAENFQAKMTVLKELVGHHC